MSETEEGAIRKVLVKKEERLLFDMALETAMRLSEMFTLSWAQVDLDRKTIFLERTKNTRAGRSGRRQVPISTVLYALLEACDRSGSTNLAATDFGGLAVDRGHGAAAQFSYALSGEDHPNLRSSRRRSA